MANITVERVIKIWDDAHGDHYYVGPDGDGLDCPELRWVDDSGKIGSRIFMGTPETALAIADAIIELYRAK